MPDRTSNKNEGTGQETKGSRPRDTADSSGISHRSKLEQDLNTDEVPISTPSESLDLEPQHHLTHMENRHPDPISLRLSLMIIAIEASNASMRQENAKLAKLNEIMRAKLEARREIEKAAKEAVKSGRDLLEARHRYLKLLEQERDILQAEADARAGAGCVIL